MPLISFVVHFEDGVLVDVHPIDVVGANVDGDARGVGDSVRDNGLAVGAVQPGSGDHGELPVVDVVEVPLDGVDGQLPGVVGGGLVDDLPVLTV